MTTKEEQLEDEHAEGEAVVVLGSVDGGEGGAMQFRGGVQGFSDFTPRRGGAVTHLQRIDVHDHDSGISWADEESPVIEVPDDVAMSMQRLHSRGHIARHSDEEAPVGDRK